MFAAYTRVSRVGDRAETLISPDLQADKIRHYAAGRGLEVDYMEPELDQSGGKVERPILQHVIAEIEAGRYAGIIVAQLDRLSRMDITDALHTIRRIESAGGEVIAVAENFDAGTPEGRMARNVILAMGEMQLERYRAQFRAAKKSAVQRGVWPVPKTPPGYKRGPDRRLVPDDPQRIVRAFEARASGRPWAEVADILGLCKTGARKTIQNRAYLGEIHLGDLVNLTAHEPIVSRSLWEAAQIQHPRPPRGRNGPALLAGLIRCAGCQRLMSADRYKDWRYRCFPHNAAGRCEAPALISMNSVEWYVQACVLPKLKGRYRGTPGSVDLSALNAAEAELAAFQEAVEVAGVGTEHFAHGLRKRVESVQQARKAVAQARQRHDSPVIGDVARLWPTLTVEERSHVLRGEVGVVWVWKGKGIDRIRVIESGFEGVFDFGPIGDDLPGEIRPPVT